jgi:hypothetical protein
MLHRELDHDGACMLWLHGIYIRNAAVSLLTDVMLPMQERIASAKRWLERQPESVIFMYGHSVFWKTFFAHTETLRNCEYRLLHW